MTGPLDKYPALKLALAPLKQWLEEPDVMEISINRPGFVFIERAGAAQMERIELPGFDKSAIEHLAERVAAATDQNVSARTPLLSASLPGGERFQAVLNPAAPDGGAISIRRQITKNLTLDEYRQSGALNKARVSTGSELSAEEQELVALLRGNDIYEFLKAAIRHKISIVISGGTSTGKTTFLNALLKEIDSSERIITIEDTLELLPPQHNVVRLLSSKGGQGIAAVDPPKLLEASLRMRPDRLLLGELRGKEAMSFLQAINTGHPGSLTTVHANSPRGAYERLALMVMESGIQLSKTEVIDYLREVIPIVVQISRLNGRRQVTDILFTRMPMQAVSL
ncbi:MAG: P-type DNA transfer ATPase VirB11 [Beijerinckiaceae bacterium]